MLRPVWFLPQSDIARAWQLPDPGAPDPVPHWSCVFKSVAVPSWKEDHFYYEPPLEEPPLETPIFDGASNIDTYGVKQEDQTGGYRNVWTAKHVGAPWATNCEIWAYGEGGLWVEPGVPLYDYLQVKVNDYGDWTDIEMPISPAYGWVTETVQYKDTVDGEKPTTITIRQKGGGDHIQLWALQIRVSGTVHGGGMESKPMMGGTAATIGRGDIRAPAAISRIG